MSSSSIVERATLAATGPTWTAIPAPGNKCDLLPIKTCYHEFCEETSTTIPASCIIEPNGLFPSGSPGIKAKDIVYQKLPMLLTPSNEESLSADDIEFFVTGRSAQEKIQLNTFILLTPKEELELSEIQLLKYRKRLATRPAVPTLDGKIGQPSPAPPARTRCFHRDPRWIQRVARLAQALADEGLGALGIQPGLKGNASSSNFDPTKVIVVNGKYVGLPLPIPTLQR
jgi:hypothetical protein